MDELHKKILAEKENVEIALANNIPGIWLHFATEIDKILKQ